jgi:hypothetical protein
LSGAPGSLRRSISLKSQAGDAAATLASYGQKRSFPCLFTRLRRSRLPTGRTNANVAGQQKRATFTSMSSCVRKATSDSERATYRPASATGGPMRAARGSSRFPVARSARADRSGTPRGGTC